MQKRKLLGRGVLAAACAAVVTVGGASVASATVFNEVEPNDSKAAANLIPNMVAGDMIVGNTQGLSTTVAGPTSADYFLVTTGALPVGIYQNRLVLTSPIVGHTGTIRGLNQIAAPADTQAGIPWDGVIGTPGTTDATIQTSSTLTVPPRYNQFYTFGRPAQMYYRVAGAAATVDDYTATMETVPVAPTPVGAYNPGLITITTFGQGHSSDTDMWVYDENFNAIRGYGNDDESVLGGTPGTGVTLQSWLARDYTPGTYYLALSNFQMALDEPSPSDDDFRTGSLMDFPGVVVNSSTTVNLNMTFTISDGVNTLQVPNTKLSQFDVNWFVFTVVPEPASLSLLTLAVPALMRRRRN